MNKDLAALAIIRVYGDDDKAFIMDTFLKGLYYDKGNNNFTNMFSLIPQNIFMKNYRPVLEALIDRSAVNVACLAEDPSVILGYSIVSKDFKTLHWVTVKQVWRGKGLGRTLVPTSVSAVSHLTGLGKTLLPKLKDCIFNPFAL